MLGMVVLAGSYGVTRASGPKEAVVSAALSNASPNPVNVLGEMPAYAEPISLIEHPTATQTSLPLASAEVKSFMQSEDADVKNEFSKNDSQSVTVEAEVRTPSLPLALEKLTVSVEPVNVPLEKSSPENANASVPGNVAHFVVDDETVLRKKLAALRTLALDSALFDDASVEMLRPPRRDSHPLAMFGSQHEVFAGLPWRPQEERALSSEASGLALEEIARFLRNSAPATFLVTESDANEELAVARKRELDALERKIFGLDVLEYDPPRTGLFKTKTRTLVRGFNVKYKMDFEKPEAIPALRQILMAEGTPARLLLIKALARIKHAESTKALANQAVFDISSQVRIAAIEALADRDEADYRDILVGGLKYPFIPVVQQSAEAIANLGTRSLLTEIDELIEGESPSFPSDQATASKSIAVVREVVRIHHNTNCKLCHQTASSKGGSGILVAKIPAQQDEYPKVSYEKFVTNQVARPQYYGFDEPAPGEPVVNANVTFLRPDFSVSLEFSRRNVREGTGRKSSQAKKAVVAFEDRFDFLVRMRPAVEADYEKHSRENSAEYFDVLRQLRHVLMNGEGPRANDQAADAVATTFSGN